MGKPSSRSVKPLAGTVIYTGVPGTTPTKRVASLSEAFPPRAGCLAYEALGFTEGGSTCVLMDCASMRAAVDKAEAELRANPLKALLRSRPLSAMYRDISPVQFALDKIMVGMSLFQRIFRPPNFGSELLSETVLAAVEANIGRETVVLDASVVSYEDYQTTHRITLPKDRTGGPEREISATAFAKPDQDVLIACGDAWDVRYAAELLPTSNLEAYAKSLPDHRPLPDLLRGKERIASENTPPVFKRLPATVKHYAAIEMVRGTDLEESARSVHHTIAHDELVYKQIAEFARVEEVGVSVEEAVSVVDEMRPYLRKAGVFDTETMYRFRDYIGVGIRDIAWPRFKDPRDNEPREFLLAKTARLVAGKEIEYQAAMAAARAPQRDLAPEIVVVTKDNAASRGYVGGLPRPTRPSAGRER